jgi:hypothetical protein
VTSLQFPGKQLDPNQSRIDMASVEGGVQSAIVRGRDGKQADDTFSPRAKNETKLKQSSRRKTVRD